MPENSRKTALQGSPSSLSKPISLFQLVPSSPSPASATLTGSISPSTPGAWASHIRPSPLPGKLSLAPRLIAPGFGAGGRGREGMRSLCALPPSPLTSLDTTTNRTRDRCGVVVAGLAIRSRQRNSTRRGRAGTRSQPRHGSNHTGLSARVTLDWLVTIRVEEGAARSDWASC